MSSRSPFYSKRVYLDKDPQEQKALEESNDEGVTVVLQNGCARERCELDPDGSISCSLLSEHEVLPMLENDVQAYSWQLPSPEMNSQQLEDLISSNSIDNQCIIGVSINHTYKMEAASYPTNDPGIPNQYYHKTINGPDAYSFFYGQRLDQVRVGVIDTGIQPEHEDIGSRGFNVNLSESCKTTICHWHGNFVSSIIGGLNNNSKGGHGIAPNAYIYSFQIGDENGKLTSTELVNAVQMATSYNVELLNLSLGGSSILDFAFQDALIKAIDKGILIISAAGNDGRDISKPGFQIYPAAFNYDGQITVAAASPSEINDATMTPPYSTAAIASTIHRDFFSNYNSGLVHIAAPGTGIYSATLNNTYGIARGTSFSTPMVTGALALIKGYLKGKGIETSPEVLRSLLFEGSTRMDSLSESIDGKMTDVVQNNRYLDLKKLKEVVTQYTDRVNATPARIEIVSSSVTTDAKGVKTVNVRVDVRDGDINAGLVLRAYTNKAFLTETFTGFECKIENARQICDAQISFSKLLIDPGVYLAITDKNGKLISDLSIPKTALNLGDKTKAALKGEIVAAYFNGSSFQIEGWACLAGFADPIAVEVRLNSNSGAPLGTFTTNRQGRGNYFATCNSPEINFGFRYTVPAIYMQMAQPYKFYFKALHAETGKSLELPVYTYQPTYNDTKPAVYWDHVYLDPNLTDQNPQIVFTKKEFSNFNLILEGSACYKSSRKPAAFTIGLGDANFKRLFPDMRAVNKYFSSGDVAASSIQAMGDINFLSRSIASINSAARKTDDAGVFGHLDDFSEALDQMTYVPRVGAASSEIKGVLVYEGDQSKVESGLITVMPTIERNDGCLYPSGFSVSINLKPYLSQLSSSFSVRYRADKYTEAQIKSLPALQQFKDLFAINAQKTVPFNSLVFDPKAFDVFVEPLVSSKKASLVFTNYKSFIDKTIPLFSTKIENKTLVKGWKDYSCQPDFNYAENPLRGWYYKSSVSNSFTLFETSLCETSTSVWGEPLSIQMTASTKMDLVPVYQTDVILLKKSSMGKMFPVITLSEGTKFGELDTDFRLQVRYNGTGLWYDVSLEDVKTVSAVTGTSVILSSDSSVPIASTSIQFRVLANGQNQFKMTSIGFYTE